MPRSSIASGLVLAILGAWLIAQAIGGNLAGRIMRSAGASDA